MGNEAQLAPGRYFISVASSTSHTRRLHVQVTKFITPCTCALKVKDGERGQLDFAGAGLLGMSTFDATQYFPH